MDERSKLTRRILVQEYDVAARGKTVSFETATDISNAMQILNPRTLAGFFLKVGLTANQVWSGSRYFTIWPIQSLGTLAHARTWMEIVEENERNKVNN